MCQYKCKHFADSYKYVIKILTFTKHKRIIGDKVSCVAVRKSHKARHFYRGRAKRRGRDAPAAQAGRNAGE